MRRSPTQTKVSYKSLLNCSSECGKGIIIIIIVFQVTTLDQQHLSRRTATHSLGLGCHAGQPMVLDQRWAAADSGPG